MPGITTSAVEVTNISRYGFLVLLDEEELLLSFEQFPWFRQATVGQITHVERPAPDHFYWPSLDVDRSVAAMRRPDDFPRSPAIPARPVRSDV